MCEKEKIWFLMESIFIKLKFREEGSEASISLKKTTKPVTWKASVILLNIYSRLTFTIFS